MIVLLIWSSSHSLPIQTLPVFLQIVLENASTIYHIKPRFNNHCMDCVFIISFYVNYMTER